MITMISGILLAVAVLAGAAIALSVAMAAVARRPKPGPAPHGGLRHTVQPEPQPDRDDARVLVLH